MLINLEEKNNEMIDNTENIENADNLEKPENLENSGNPEEPENLENSGNPEEPENLENSKNPEEPENLENSENPEEPENLENSGNPEEPENLENSGNPVEPENLENSGNPEEPENLENSENLEKPENLENSVDPEKADGLDKNGKGKKKPRVRRRLTRKEWILLLIPSVLLVLAIVLVLKAGQGIRSYKLEGNLRQYYGGGEFKITSGSVLRRSPDGKTSIEENNESREMDSLPIYIDGKDTVILPKEMIYYAPRSHSYYRLDYFTQITVDRNGTITAKSGDKKKTLEAGFLYDGNDFYLFLEPVTVEFNGYRLELSALSYIEAAFTADVMVFDYRTGEFVIEPPKADAVARIESGDYSVSLLGDSLTMFDGSRMLLFTRPELLDTPD